MVQTEDCKNKILAYKLRENKSTKSLGLSLGTEWHGPFVFCLYKVSGYMQYTISGNKLWWLKLVIQRRTLILEPKQTAPHKIIK